MNILRRHTYIFLHIVMVTLLTTSITYCSKRKADEIEDINYIVTPAKKLFSEHIETALTAPRFEITEGSLNEACLVPPAVHGKTLKKVSQEYINLFKQILNPRMQIDIGALILGSIANGTKIKATAKSILHKPWEVLPLKNLAGHAIFMTIVHPANTTKSRAKMQKLHCAPSFHCNVTFPVPLLGHKHGIARPAD